MAHTHGKEDQGTNTAMQECKRKEKTREECDKLWSGSKAHTHETHILIHFKPNIKEHCSMQRIKAGKLNWKRPRTNRIKQVNRVSGREILLKSSSN